MQHRSENFPPKIADGADLDDRRGHKRASNRDVFGHVEPGHAVPFRAHGFDVPLYVRLCFGGDDRTDVRCENVGIADAQFSQRALEHVQRPVGHVLLQAQHAQRGAALTRAVEG